MLFYGSLQDHNIKEVVTLISIVQMDLCQTFESIESTTMRMISYHSVEKDSWFTCDNDPTSNMSNTICSLPANTIFSLPANTLLSSVAGEEAALCTDTVQLIVGQKVAF